MNKKDLFYLNKIFPEPEKVFSFKYKEINDIKDTCIYILDTNVLLIPYFTSKDSLDDFKRIFSKLKNENRLIIPARVAMEFAANRGTKLARIFATIHEVKDQLNKSDFKFENFPILEGQTNYENIITIQNKINKLKPEFRKNLDSLGDYVQKWNWNDPVSQLYREIFTNDLIVKLKKSESDIEEDLNFRIQHEIPPGYKDSKKIDQGIGDLIIWHTILQIGKELNNDVIFVTNEKKMIGFTFNIKLDYIRDSNYTKNSEDLQTRNLLT